MSKQLPEYIADLGEVPAAAHGFYVGTADGRFRLNIAAETDTRPAAGGGKDGAPPMSRAQEAAAFKRAFAARCVALWNPREENREAVVDLVEKSLRVDRADDGSLIATPITSDGTQVPSAIEGVKYATADEFMASNPVLTSHPDLFHRTEPTPEARPEPEVFKPTSPDVQLQPGFSQHDFEQATALAHNRGGEVLLPASKASEPLSRQHNPRDVPLQAGFTQEEFEAATQKSFEQGGDIVMPN